MRNQPAGKRPRNAGGRRALSEADIRKTIIGNTLNFLAPSNGKDLFVYFAEDGVVQLKATGSPKIVSKKWFFKARGLLCRTAGRQNRNHCTKVRNKNGSDVFLMFNKKVKYEAKLFEGRHLSE